MKTDEDVRMISAETPVLFARAVEMFIVELTFRGWQHNGGILSKKRTLQRPDILSCVQQRDVFDFLQDILTEEDKASLRAGPAIAGEAAPLSPNPLPPCTNVSQSAHEIGGPHSKGVPLTSPAYLIPQSLSQAQQHREPSVLNAPGLPLMQQNQYNTGVSSTQTATTFRTGKEDRGVGGPPSA